MTEKKANMLNYKLESSADLHVINNPPLVLSEVEGEGRFMMLAHSIGSLRLQLVSHSAVCSN